MTEIHVESEVRIILARVWRAGAWRNEKESQAPAVSEITATGIVFAISDILLWQSC
jgi:hypothetical protein